MGVSPPYFGSSYYEDSLNISYYLLAKFFAAFLTISFIYAYVGVHV